MLVIGAGLTLATMPREASAIDVATTAANHNHRFEAWGTSLAWMGNELGRSSTNSLRRTQLMDLMFDPTNGLGMNFVRYNIGAGSNPDTSIQNITRPGAKMDGWVPDRPTDILDPDTWVWDWEADATQRLILDMAIDRGVTTVEAFANSAPWWLTRNEQSNGISGGGSNLSNANVDEFAHYMLDVVDHFEINLGIKFETLAPMNEPGSGFWNGNSNQEGMGVPTGSFPWQDRLIKTFGAEIENRGVDIKQVGLEETSTDQSGDSWSNPNLTDEAKAYLSQVNTHTYGFNGGSLQSDSERLFDLVSADDKKIWATEYGTGQGAVRLATQINRDIRYLDAGGWTYWQATEDNNGSGWGLTTTFFNGSNNRFDVQDQYFAFKQFSAHIRPGSEIIELPGQENITAAYDPRTGTTALVVTNDGANGSSEQYSFDLLDRDVVSTRLIRTTDENNSSLTNAYQSFGPATFDGGTNVSFDAAGNAITTLVVHHRPNLIDNANFDPNGLPDNSPQFDQWQATGNVVFDTGADNSGDGTGSAQLQTNSVGNSGKIFQTGIGGADTDLTGVAYRLSLDVQFRNQGGSEYDADTFLALEFYGADDQTLATVSLNDYVTEIDPEFAVKRNNFESSVDGSDPNDSVYRTYVSGRFVAPEGTRYVRPVVGFDGVGSGSNSVVSLDNIRLQEVHPEAAAREWKTEGGGDWSDNAAWTNHSLVENNKHAYFGNAIDEDSAIVVGETQQVSGITFFSDHTYHLQPQPGSNGRLEIGEGNPGENSLIDVRWGFHRISTDTTLNNDLDVQVLPGTVLLIDNGFDLNGQDVRKLGAGTAIFGQGFEMNGGTLSAYASPTATIAFGSDAVLDGDFELLLAPGQSVGLGDLFAIASYSSLNDTFDSLILPSLTSDLDWDISYGPALLTAEVVSSVIVGDYNGDGFVSQGDLDLVLLNWGDTVLPTGFELNGLPGGGAFDNLISQNELDGVLLNWGNGTPPANAIPEPGAAVLMGVLGCVTLCRRRVS